MTRHRLHHITLGLLLLIGITLVAQATTVTSRHLLVNLIALDLSKRLLPTVEPLKAHDLLGLDLRANRDDFDKTLAQLDSLVFSSKEQQEVQHILRLRNMTLLLVGKPEQVIGDSALLASDDVSQLSLAIAYGQTYQLDKVTDTLSHMPQGVTILRNAVHFAWDNRLEPDLSLAITAGELLITLHHESATDMSDIHRILSYAYERSGDYGRAIAAAERWLETMPNDCGPNQQIVALYLRSRKSVQALQGLNRWRANGGSDCSAFPGQLAQVYDQGGDLQRALPLYQEDAVRNPMDPLVQFYFGYALYRSGRLEEALPVLQNVLAVADPATAARASALLRQLSGRVSPVPER